MMIVVNQKLLIGWQDNVSYGTDYVSDSNAPYPTGTIEFPVEDDPAAWKEKEAVEFVANFNPLLSGESVNVKFKKDDDADWTSNTASPVTGDSVIRQLTTTGRYNQIQLAVDLSTSVSTSPKLNSALIVVDALESEGRYG